MRRADSRLRLRLPGWVRHALAAAAIACGWLAAIACSACGWLAATAAPARADGRLLEGVAYAGASDGVRTLDLYLPDRPPGGALPPLVVFLHSRFWDRADRERDVAHRFARPLQRAGVAVAVVRHRLAPAHVHPAGARDAAAAVAFLIAHAGEHGYDADRITLAGRSSGAHLAALIALDPGYLAEHGVSPDRIHGVAGWSGVYDLDPPAGAIPDEVRALYAGAFGDAAARRAASPLQLARADGPIFLLLVAEHDLPGARDDAFRFSEALREAGHPAAETFLEMGRDHWSMLDLASEASPARRHLLALLGVDETDGSILDIFATRRFWRDPSFSTAGFWEDAEHVTSHPPDTRFLDALNLLFARPGAPHPLRPARYHALDLLDWVERHVPGSGDFLTLENARGERLVWQRSRLRAARPRLVIGLDEERELFRLTTWYHTLRRYSWRDAAPERWVLARPLGAFVHFPEPPPADLEPGVVGRFAIEPAGIRISDEDPLAPLRDLPADEQALVAGELACVSCHGFRGTGARAGHLRARDGERVGGFALPLEEYPPEVWRRYCFEQAAVAAEIGATPVPLGERARRLFELIERERRR
jgi:acetyl esterase/lipase